MKLEARSYRKAGVLVFVLGCFLLWQNWPVNAQGTHGVRVSWTASVTPAVDGYSVYRGTVAGQTNTKLNATLTTALSLDDTTGVGGTTYFYTVTASKGGIESARSNEVSAAFPLVPAAPAGVSATPF